MKIEIKSWITGNVIFSFEKEENSIKITIEAAVNSDANLWGANLRGARGNNSQVKSLHASKYDVT